MSENLKPARAGRRRDGRKPVDDQRPRREYRRQVAQLERILLKQVRGNEGRSQATQPEKQVQQIQHRSSIASG